MPIISLVLGIICTLALFDDSDWDHDTIVGLIMFSTIGLILGVFGVNQRSDAKGVAIAGVVLCAVMLLVFVGMLIG